MSTSVKRIESTQRGAPTLNGQAGTLLAVLEALFVTGWGPTTPLSVNVAGGIATAMLTPGETFDRDAVVLIAGFTPGALNGEARVLTTSNSSITWATTAPDGAATGAGTIRYAPQTSWSKPFAKTNVGAFRSTHVQSNGHYLRIDDTGTTTARVRGYESMTDVDTGTGPFPTDAQMSGGGYLHKSTAANATACRYRIFCDERFIVFATAAGSGATAANRTANARGFGDPIILAPGGDAWGTVLCYAGSSGATSYTGALDNALTSGANGGCAFPRSITGLGSAVLGDVQVFSGAINIISGTDNTLGAFPSEVDGRLRHVRTFIKEVGTTKPPRVITPAVYFVPQSGVASLIADGDTLDGSGDLAGHRLMCVSTGTGYSGAPTGIYLVDITGPWR